MKNYRPVSNLNFISTIIEKNISNRIRFHLDKNNLSNPNQSAYKPLHSTETALLEIHNEICMSMESGKTTALVLLGLSAAFDTMVHSSLCRCLTAAVTKTIAASLVSSKLDYCNYILYNIPHRKINKLQCSELLGQGCDPLYAILQFYTFVTIPTLAPCSIQNKIQNMHPTKLSSNIYMSASITT